MVERKHPARHSPVRIGNLSVILFVTVCTKGKRPILGRPEVHDLLREVWLESKRWYVGRYVIMPDHLHLFCAPNRFDSEPLAKWLQFWKSRSALRWPQPEEQPIWQRDGWDTQLRSGDHYGLKWDYVRNNPVRKGLVKNADDWPFQGEIHELMWHEA